MITMQSNEIKSRLSEVLRKVEAGQEVTITRHGKAIAKLSPWNKKADRTDFEKAVKQMQGFAKQNLPADETIRSLRDTGRR